MRRVMVVGQPGSGKSTFARALGHRTGLPVIHIDHIHWQPGWVERPREEKTRLCREAEAREAWIFEGGHSATWGTRVARADLLVWLDRPVALRLWRVTRRMLRDLGRTRPGRPEGCPERLRNWPAFAAFIWRNRKVGRAAMARLAAGAPCRVVRLASDRDVAAFLKKEPGARRPPDPRIRGVRDGKGA
jgi:adenylate kinase family enzyme